MPAQMFNAEEGFVISGKIAFVIVSGVPGASGRSSTVAKGSLAFDEVSGEFYRKKEDGTGAEKWKRIPTDEEIAVEVSWREPVEVADTTTLALPTGTPSQTIDIDGYTINNNQRVLFTGLTDGNNLNVYIYDTGTGTFTEDTNAATKGDKVYVNHGTCAGHDMAYNGTTWVKSNAITQDELGFIRTFIGKNAVGTENPDYGATPNHVSSTLNLEAAIAKLDEIAGKRTAGGTGTVYGDIEALETKVDGAYTTTKVTGATPGTRVPDNILVAEAMAAKWIVHIKSGDTVQMAEILASHNGESGTDATEVDWTVYSKLEVGTIPVTQKAVYSVALNGSGALQQMQLTLTVLQPSSDIRTMRETILP